MSSLPLTSSLGDVRASVGDPAACINEVNTEITLMIHPKYMTKQGEGVKRELDALAKRYNKSLGGMVVAYDSVKLISQGWIFDANPFLHLRVAAKFYVFSPSDGDTLRAVVHKKAKHHLGCLAHGLYNVSVPRPNTESSESWAGSWVNEGDELRLTVLFCSLTNYHMPYIRAAIHPDCIKDLQKRQEEEEAATEEHKDPIDEPRQNQRTVFEEDSGISSNEVEKQKEKEIKKKKKKKKRKRDEMEEVTVKIERTSSDEEGRRRKKRKKEKVVIKSEVMSEEEAPKQKTEERVEESRVKEQKDRRKVKAKQKIKTEECEESESLPVPLYIIKKECDTPKRKFKKELG